MLFTLRPNYRVSSLPAWSYPVFPHEIERFNGGSNSLCSQGGPVSLPWGALPVVVHDLSVLTSRCHDLLATGNTRKCILPHFHYFYLKQEFCSKGFLGFFWYSVYVPVQLV